MSFLFHKQCIICLFLEYVKLTDKVPVIKKKNFWKIRINIQYVFHVILHEDIL